jgi:hypothetical protein
MVVNGVIIIRYYRRWDGETVETEVFFFCPAMWVCAFDFMYDDSYIVAFFSCIADGEAVPAE